MTDPDISLKDYLDAQLTEVRRAVEIATSASRVEGVPLRQFVEAILDEQKRALEMAEREREKAAQALRDQQQKALDKADGEREKAASALREEQYRATQTAEREREKAASALRAELARSILEGDERLREHIANQIMQIKAALDSAEKLELARLHEARERTDAVAREVGLVHDASEKAIQKAEAAAEKRFESVNEFRSQLSDQTATYLPREVADAQFTELRKLVATNTERLNSLSGSAANQQRNQDRMQPWQLWAAGVIITVFLSIVVLAANILTT